MSYVAHLLKKNNSIVVFEKWLTNTTLLLRLLLKRIAGGY